MNQESMKQKLQELLNDVVAKNAGIRSGMAAVSALLLYRLTPGDRRVISDVAYAGTSEITNDLLPSLGITVKKVNMSDLAEVESAVKEGAKLVFERRPAVCRCRECETDFHPEGFDWNCPACGEMAFEVVSGREFRIESIEVEDRLTEGGNPVE